MFKKIFLFSFLIFTLIGIIYPTKKENTKIFDYCYSLERMLSMNSIQRRKNLEGNFKSISKDITKFGIRQTKGALINKMIDQYKSSNNSLIIKFIHNELYCLAGYWIEEFKPGTFESIFFAQSKKKINQFKEMKNEIDELLNDINSEYKTLQKEFNIHF